MYCLVGSKALGFFKRELEAQALAQRVSPTIWAYALPVSSAPARLAADVGDGDCCRSGDRNCGTKGTAESFQLPK